MAKINRVLASQDYEQDIFDSYYNRCNRLRLSTQNVKDVDATNLSHDIYMSLFQSNPDILDLGITKNVFNQLMMLPDFISLRGNTVKSDIVSALGYTRIAKPIFDQVEKLVKFQKEEQKKQEQQGKKEEQKQDKKEEKKEDKKEEQKKDDEGKKDDNKEGKEQGDEGQPNQDQKGNEQGQEGKGKGEEKEGEGQGQEQGEQGQGEGQGQGQGEGQEQNEGQGQGRSEGQSEGKQQQSKGKPSGSQGKEGSRPDGETEQEQLGQGQQAIKSEVGKELKIPAKMLAEIRNSLRPHIEEALEAAEEYNNAVQGFGIKEDDIIHLNPDQQLQFAEQLIYNKEYQKIADLMGRFQNVIKSTVAKSFTHGYEEIVDVGMGADLKRLLPSEIIKLQTQPALFYKDMVEGRLLQYNMRGEEESGRGPIVCLLDISASMRGEKAIWSKSLVLAMAALAEKQKRAFAVLFFHVKVVDMIVVSKGQKLSMKDKFKIASMATNGGGTEFFSPLMDAFKIISKQGEFKVADIAFVTDGDSRISSDELKKIKAAKDLTNARIQSIGVQVQKWDVLEQFSDTVSIVNNMQDIEVLAQVAKKTASKPFTGADPMKAGAVKSYGRF